MVKLEIYCLFKCFKRKLIDDANYIILIYMMINDNNSQVLQKIQRQQL